jgi:hypothetical protein
MKNTIKVLGVIALAAVIWFSFAACNFDNDKDDDDNGGGGNSNRLIVTGLPNSNNTWAASIFDAGTDVSTLSKWASANQYIRYTGSNGGKGNVFYAFVNPSPPFKYWTGSGSHVVVLNKVDTGDNYYATVNFSSGNTTVEYSSFTNIPLN